VCLIIVDKEKQNVGSPLFGASPSDRVPNATEDANVRCLSPVAILVNFTKEFRKIF
jgi:hypothetical protein